MKPANLFKPPSSEGTNSPQRALRWQAQSGGNDKEGNDAPAEDKAPVEEARSEKSGSTSRTSTVKSSSKTSSHKKKGRSTSSKASSKEDEGPTEPGQVDWYGDPLVPGIDASLGPGGNLYNFTAKGKHRPGMCNPPMNPAVRAALVKDLNEWQVEPLVKPRKAKPENLDEGEKKQKMMPRRSAVASRSLGSLQDDGIAEASRENASTAPAGGFYGGSSGSSRMSSPMRHSNSATSHAHRGGSHLVRGRRKRAESNWQLDLTQEGPTKHGLESAPEGEVKWHAHKLKAKSRDHGFTLEKMEVEELGHLSMYHNWLSRGPLQHPLPVVHPVLPARQLKDLSTDMLSTSQSLNSLSDYTVKTELINAQRVPRSSCNYGAAEAPSMERYMEMAAASKHYGPHELERMLASTGISVHTGARFLDGSGRQNSEDDPLFSARLGATPRTSTGKPLPVPHWGKTGTAPVLREAPELRQARERAEAAREC